MLRPQSLRRSVLTSLALALPLSPARATSDTWSVNVGGHGDFVELQQAVDHALPGDTILVWGPANGHQMLRRVTITKGLTIVGLATEPVRLDDLTVRDVPAGESVVLVNVSVGESLTFPYTQAFDEQDRGEGALVEDCAGAVVFRGCFFRGGRANPGGPGVRAVRADVALLDCELHGGREGDSGTSPTGLPNSQHALVLEDARAFVAGSLLSGADGVYYKAWLDQTGGDGGDGVRAAGASSLWLLDSTVLGGTGDEVQGISNCIGGDGGAGVRLDPSSRGLARASTIEGGAGGVGGTAPGQPGEDVIGALGVQSGAALSLDVPLWARDVDPVQVTVRGEPGTSAFLVVGDATRFRGLGRAGVSVVGGATSIALGPLPPWGQVTVPLPLPALPSGGSQLLVVQSVLREPARLVFGEARALVVLDERWLPEGARRYYVDAAAPPGGDGGSWDDAFSDLRVALEASTGIGPGLTDIWVREGVYRPIPSTPTPIEPFFVKSRTRLYGGFAGTEEELSQRETWLHPTVLTGDLLGNDTASDASRDDNSRVVVAVGPWEPRTGVRVDGLTIRAGYNDQIWGNFLTPYGSSGIEVQGSVDVVGCTFADHRLASALRAWVGSDLRVVGCRFLGNVGASFNGTLGTCRVDGWYAGRALFADCEFVANAANVGGAIYCQAETRIVSCTFYGNSAHSGGAVLAGYSCRGLSIENSLFWDNVAQVSPDIHGDSPTLPLRVDYSLLQGGSTSTWGVGNVEGPPRLLDPDGADGVLGTIDDDLTPRTSSPAVDAGNNAFLPADELDLDADGDVLELLPIDVIGRPRRADDPNVPDTGSGTPPIVDIGSRERP